MNAETKAMNDWAETDEAKNRCDPETLGDSSAKRRHFLVNRLWKTLQEGIEIGRKLQLAEDRERLLSLLK